MHPLFFMDDMRFCEILWNFVRFCEILWDFVRLLVEHESCKVKMWKLIINIRELFMAKSLITMTLYYFLNTMYLTILTLCLIFGNLMQNLRQTFFLTKSHASPDFAGWGEILWDFVRLDPPKQQKTQFWSSQGWGPPSP